MQPATLGRYRIVRVLGRGGMGVVYGGHDPQIDRPVAIKTIALEALSAEEQSIFEARFRAEMRSTGRLLHHNIAALYDTGRDGGTAFIVMELVEGQDLRRRLSAGERFGLTQALDIAVQLLAALDFAHRHHVIHRDVKPANVMLRDDGVVKLCDFGVARLADADATRTQGMVVGSLRYASPEQVTGQPVDARTDIFSTGVLLFELLTGRTPFPGQTDAEVLHRIATGEVPSARELNPEIPRDLDAALKRALARDPESRFASASDFARALGASLGGSTQASADTLAPTSGPMPTRPLPAPTAPPIAPAATPAPAWGRRAMLLGGGALAALAAGWYVGRTPSTEPQPPRAPAASAARLPASPAAAASVAMAPLPPPSTAASAIVATAPAAAPAPASVAPAVAASAPRVAAASSAPPPPVPVRPGDGPWSGPLRCGKSLIPGNSGPAFEPFVNDVEITVAGSAFTWVRPMRTGRESGTGRFDAQGRFTVQGKGQLHDGSSSWLMRGQGQLRNGRLEGTVQLLRPADSFVARECGWQAQRGALRTTASPAPAAPSAPAPQTWPGELACGPLLNAPRNATRQEAFSQAVKVEVGPQRVGWVRESKTAFESASGRLEPGGRFSAEGEGRYKDEPERNPWRVRAQGQLDVRAQQLDARVQLLRQKDGSISRECTLRARKP
ncbi:MAG: serine/threonine-protein kinase [Rubrivivax sp.]